MNDVNLFTDLTENEIRALEAKILSAFLKTHIGTYMATEMAMVHVLILAEINTRNFGGLK